MSTTDSLAACPYCARVQYPLDAEPWQCPDCNFFIRRKDMATPGQEPALDAVSRDYCPWCAFPVAQEHSVPEEEEFICAGCAGTLTADMLETQRAIDAYRKRKMSGTGFLAFLIIVTLVMLIAVFYILP